MFQAKLVEKIKTHVLRSITFHENRDVSETMRRKYGTTGQTIDENVTWRMRFERWITTGTDTHSEYESLLPFLGKQ